MIIDAHTHIMSPEIASAKATYYARERWFDECYNHPKAKFATAESLLASMDAAGVDRAVVTGFAFAGGDLCAASNDYLIEAVRRYPARLIGLAAVQPLDGDRAVYEAERCLAAGLSGLGELLPDGQGFDPADKATMAPLAALLETYRRPVMLHTSEPVGHLYPGKGRTWPNQIAALAQNFPGLKVIAAHWGGGLPFYELMPEIQVALQNVYYDTAATTYLYNFRVFRSVADLCGPAKILFASDHPLLRPDRLLARIRLEGGLSESELALALGENAARLFELENNR
jgi:predicted TIM-barrel fold metal-dependent hydrolase